MKTFNQLIEQCRTHVKEIMPWDLADQLAEGANPLLLDVREPNEYQAMHIKGSINVPRGVLESACEYGYEETNPELVAARDREVIAICRSGNRSLLAASTLQELGYKNVKSLNTGLRGWNDFEQALIDANGNSVDIEVADEFFTSRVRPEQMKPKQ